MYNEGIITYLRIQRSGFFVRHVPVAAAEVIEAVDAAVSRDEYFSFIEASILPRNISKAISIPGHVLGPWRSSNTIRAIENCHPVRHGSVAMSLRDIASLHTVKSYVAPRSWTIKQRTVTQYNTPPPKLSNP